MSHRLASGLVAAAVVALLQSCNSMVYSPYMHLPSSPPLAGETEALVSAEMLPEAYSPYYYAEGGGSALLRYSITDNFTIQGRAWSRSYSLQHFWADGGSIDAIILLGKRTHSEGTSEWQFALVPRLLAMREGNTIGGGGVSLSLAAWMPEFLGMYPTLALGAIGGYGNDRDQWRGTSIYGGGGVIANAGLSGRVFDAVELGGELAMPVIYQSYSHRWTGVITPSLRASVKF